VPAYAEAVYELPELAKPSRIVVDNQRLYIVDGTSIFIYSLKDYSLIKKFGRQGEGPGELKGFISYLEVHQDYMLVYSEGRLSWFTLEGTFVKQKTETSIGLNFKAIGDGFVGQKLIREKDGIYFGIFLFDANLKTKIEFYRYRHPFFGKRRKGKVNASDVRISSYYIHNDNIFVDKDDGCIWVYDQNGAKVNQICPDLKKVRITPEHKKRFLEFWRTDLKGEYEAFQDRMEFPAYFPLIKDFLVTDGRLFILTYQEKEGGNEILIYDLKGNKLKRSWAPMHKVNPLLPHLFSRYAIKNHRIYILQDNEETETWEIRIANL
jgi:hypothetical protein